MKIDMNYAFELLKKLEEEYPNTQQNIDNLKGKAHLLYLVDEGFVTEEIPNNTSYPVTYRINSDGLNLLSGQSFLEWLESNHRP